MPSCVSVCMWVCLHARMSVCFLPCSPTLSRGELASSASVFSPRGTVQCCVGGTRGIHSICSPFIRYHSEEKKKKKREATWHNSSLQDTFYCLKNKASFSFALQNRRIDRIILSQGLWILCHTEEKKHVWEENVSLNRVQRCCRGILRNNNWYPCVWARALRDILFCHTNLNTN